MTLKFRFICYLTAITVCLGALTFAYMAPREELHVYLIVAEVAFLALLFYGIDLVAKIFKPLELLQESKQLLKESEFTAHILPVGHPQADELISIYNKLATQLRKERVFNREQENLLSKIIAATQTGIISLDYDRQVEKLNPAASHFLKRESQDLVGLALTDIHHPLAQALATLEVGHSHVVDTPHHQKVRCVHAQYLDRGFYKSFYFLDELTRELLHAEKEAYHQMVRVMSHEINNSMGVTHSLLQSLLKYQEQIQAEDRTDFQAAIEVALSRTEHLQRFTKAYAKVFKLPKPQKHPTHLTTLLKQVVQLMGPAAKKRRINLQLHLQATEASINLDLDQMEQVLVNLIKNAMEAAGDDGKVTVRLERVQHVWTIQIEDSGPGISEDIATKIFSPFFSTKQEGQGIGLTLVREILEQHNFRYVLENTPEHHGRFSIYLQ